MRAMQLIYFRFTLLWLFYDDDDDVGDKAVANYVKNLFNFYMTLLLYT